MQQIKIHSFNTAFNTAYDKRVNTLGTSVYISEPFDQSSAPKSPPTNQFQAIWDTGATNTAITQKVVQTCGLQPTGMAKINTANGEMTKPTYLVSVWLPNKVCIPQLHVTETTIQGADVLLGMDVIGQGDFAVTNKDGKTNLSFRMPSIECIDFVKQQPTVIKSGNQPLHRVGRNDPCPCGSGRKYKKCHGQ